MDFDVEQVRKSCAESSTFKEFLTQLGINPSNHTGRDKLKVFMSENDISYQHFTTAHRQPRSATRRKFPAFDCPVCGKRVPEKEWETKFCSHSCAAIVNNQQFPKRMPHLTPKNTCVDCGRCLKNPRSLRCFRCKTLFTLSVFEQRTLENVTRRGNARTKYADIRRNAVKKMEVSDTPKKCQLCNFDVVVEVHHIKPISSFNESTLISEVNSLENLVYLCPNHHAMAERGLLDAGALAGKLNPDSLVESQMN